MHCQFCNEPIEQEEFQMGEIIGIDDNYWHADCYAEYFGITLEEALEEVS